MKSFEPGLYYISNRTDMIKLLCQRCKPLSSHGWSSHSDHLSALVVRHLPREQQIQDITPFPHGLFPRLATPREDLKWRSVGASGTGTSGQADTAEEVGLDWTHPQEASIQHHTPNPDLEPAGEKKERLASQQLEARHWSRAETAGDQLVRNDHNSPKQCDGRGSLMAYAPPGAMGISK